MIDLDANATTRMLPAVLESMLPWLDAGYANPSSSYSAAKQARRAIEEARASVADLIGASPEEIIFTSGGTESTNTALRALDALTAPGTAVTSSIEHSAVLRCLETFQRETQRCPVDAGGRVDPAAFDKLAQGASFVSIMAANNETGVIQPLDEIIAIAKFHGLPIHSDAIQAVGKIPLDVGLNRCDLLSISSHKFHGPKGIGALYVRRGLRFKPLLMGGGQESGRRSGTENTAAIVGMGEAARQAKAALDASSVSRIGKLRDEFESRVISQLTGVTVNGNLSHRLPNTSHLSFDHCDASGLLILMDEAGIQCSAGSACMTGKQQPSHVQLAMGIPASRAKSSLRFSFSRFNHDDDPANAADAVIRAVLKLRSIQGPGVGPVSVYPA